MHRILSLTALAAAATIAGFQAANAGFLGMPIGLQSAIRHIRFETPTLPPMAYTMFCLRYEDQCRAKPIFRGGCV